MAKKLNVPNILGLDTGQTSPGVLVYLQAVQDALNTVDDKTLYRDAVTVTAPNPTIRAKTAQGQTFSVTGTNLASGDDYIVLVQNFQALLESHIKLSDAFATLVEQIKGN